MGKRKKKPVVDQYDEPTPEQFGKGTFVQGGNLATDTNERGGVAYKRVPMIDTLAQTGRLTAAQHQALASYRDVALMFEASPISDSTQALLQTSGGNALHIPRALIHMKQWEGSWEGVGHCFDRELGSLRFIAFAIAVEDMSPSQWAMKQTGAIERRRAKGNKVIVWFEPRRKALEIAMLEIRAAAGRIAAAIAA